MRLLRVSVIQEERAARRPPPLLFAFPPPRLAPARDPWPRAHRGSPAARARAPPPLAGPPCRQGGERGPEPPPSFFSPPPSVSAPPSPPVCLGHCIPPASPCVPKRFAIEKAARRPESLPDARPNCDLKTGKKKKTCSQKLPAPPPPQLSVRPDLKSEEQPESGPYTHIAASHKHTPSSCLVLLPLSPPCFFSSFARASCLAIAPGNSSASVSSVLNAISRKPLLLNVPLPFSM